VSETFFISDTHFEHEAIMRHCKRPFVTVDDMNAHIASVWNATVSSGDLVYIIGDFAWRNHRKWVNELNGKKILIIGNHDKMPQDVLDLFKPDWVCEDVTVRDAVKTLVQFREVHQQLDRVICGQRMTLNHYPMRSWSSSIHGTWCICGHAHGRCRESQPDMTMGGLILDVGWDVHKKPLRFDEVKAIMQKKLMAQPQNFIDHVLYRKPFVRTGNDEVD